MKRVLVIGFGAIGQKILSELSAHQHLSFAVFMRPGPDRDLDQCHAPIIHDEEGIAAFNPDLIVEAAGHNVVRDSVSNWLRAGIDVLVSSVGALQDASLYSRLVQAAIEGGSTLLIPSGALAGIDYIQAVGAVDGTRIQYESRKPLNAWRDELERLGQWNEAMQRPVTLYQGDAARAAALYPANLNVAATLALAAGGFDRVHLTVIADPQAQGNTHSIDVIGPVGEMHVRVVNRPAPDNPKTSMLVAHSITRAIERHFAPIRIM